jgi:5-methylcytosine-specific restriction endonuclease McrA
MMFRKFALDSHGDVILPKDYTKECRSCHVFKPLSDYNFQLLSSDQHVAYCRICQSSYMRERRQKRRGLDSEILAKTCSVCRVKKPSGAFHISAITNDSLSSYCKACQSAFGKAWYRNNKKQHYASTRRWDVENPERSREIRKKAKQSPVGNSNRRSRSRRGSYTRDEWVALLASVNNTCLCCGDPGPLTVDHIVPLSLGGLNKIENIQPLCLSCNTQKGVRIRDYRYARSA